MYVRMVLLALVVIGVAGTGLTFWVLAQPEADVALERRVAAEFLGVAPDRVAAKQVEPYVTSWRGGERRTTRWRYAGRDPEARGDGTADVEVDLDMYYVSYLNWHDDRAHWGPDRAHWGPLNGQNTRLLAPDKAEAVACDYVQRKCWFFRAEDRLTYERYEDHVPQPYFSFEWEGQGPEGYQHRVTRIMCLNHTSASSGRGKARKGTSIG